VSAPGTSSRGARGLRDSGTSAATATSPSTITGTLIRNTEPHQNLSSSQPPTIGPIGKLAALAVTHTLSALARSAGSNSTGSTAMDSGIRNAALRPSAALAPISAPAEPA